MQLGTSILSTIEPGIQLLTADSRWEFDRVLPTDALSPDFIADAISESLNTMLDQGFQRGVALDWSTVRTRFGPQPHITTVLIVEVDVLR